MIALSIPQIKWICVVLWVIFGKDLALGGNKASNRDINCIIWTIVQWGTGMSQRIDWPQDPLKSVLCGADWTARWDSRKVNSPTGVSVSAN